MRCPADHEPFYSHADATRALANLVRIAKKTGKGGKSWKRLTVFQCGNHYHVGRANHFNSSYQNRKTPKLQPAPKPHSWGYIRKRVERIGKQIEHDRQKRIEAINRIMEAERAIEEANAEYIQAQREVLALFFPQDQ